MTDPLCTLPLLLGVFFLTGCVSKVTSPADDMLRTIPRSEWIMLDQNFSTSSEDTQLHWLDSFENNSLKKAVLIAWKKNPNLASMRELTLVRGEEAVIVGAVLFPQANLGLNGSRSKRNLIGFNFPNGSSTFTTESFTSGINLSWEIDLWGKLRNERNSAKKRFQIAQAELEGARLSLAGQVAKAWFGIVESNKQLELARQMSATFQKNKNFISARFSNGLASSLENDLATNALLSSKATQSMRLRHRNELIREMDLFLGDYPNDPNDGNFTDELPQLALAPFPQTPAKVMENRPDLQAARFQLEAAGHDLSASRLSLLPTLSLSGGPGSRSEVFEDLLDKRFRIWDLAGSLTQPILNGGRLRAKIRLSKALKSSAQANYRSIALRAFSEVEQLLANEKFLRSEATYLASAAKAARSAADSSWERYRGGVLGIFDTLESQRHAYESESRLLSLRRERIFNRIDLFLALGYPALPRTV